MPERVRLTGDEVRARRLAKLLDDVERLTRDAARDVGGAVTIQAQTHPKRRPRTRGMAWAIDPEARADSAPEK